MSSPSASSLIVPVGQLIGADYDVAPPGGSAFQVRVGPDIVRLSAAQFVVWGLAHGRGDGAPDQPWTALSVVRAAKEQGLPDAEDILVGLIADYLLFQVTPGSPDAVDFAQRHRLVPLMLGLGNSAERPEVYAVGLPGQPVVEMSSTAYDLYEWAHLDPSLWVACEGAAATAEQVGITDLVATDPRRMLDSLLATVHTFLSPNAIYFDTRLDREPASSGGAP